MTLIKRYFIPYRRFAFTVKGVHKVTGEVKDFEAISTWMGGAVEELSKKHKDWTFSY